MKKTKKTLALAAMKRAAARFKKLTKAEKRVVIARDVIAQLDLKRLKARHNTYVDLVGSPAEIQSDSVQVCDLTVGRKCEVCALGAMFVTAVERADRLTVADTSHGWGYGELEGIGGEDCYHYLSRFFSHGQLALIENAFEGFNENAFAAVARSPSARMRLVMQNIIDNGGKFVMPKAENSAA